MGDNLGAARQEIGENSPTTCPMATMQRKALTGERPARAEQLHGPRTGARHSREGGAPSLPISPWCPQHLGKRVPVCGSSSWNCVMERCLEKSSMELQQLEKQMAQMKASAQNHSLAEVGRDLWR